MSFGESGRRTVKPLIKLFTVALRCICDHRMTRNHWRLYAIYSASRCSRTLIQAIGHLWCLYVYTEPDVSQNARCKFGQWLWTSDATEAWSWAHPRVTIWWTSAHAIRKMILPITMTRLKSYIVIILQVQSIWKLECRPMPNVMAALLNTGGTLCSTPRSFWLTLTRMTAVQ